MSVERAAVLKLISSCHIFRGIESSKLEEVIDLFEVADYAPAAVIFQQGDDIAYFYFVYDGKLKVTRSFSRYAQPVPYGILEEGDYFGQEILDEKMVCQETISSEAECTLLRLDLAALKTLVDRFPNLSSHLQLVLDTYRLALHSRFSWLEPEETVYYVARRHAFFMLRNITIPILLGVTSLFLFLILHLYLALPILTSGLIGGILFGISLALGIWSWVDWSNDYYFITNRRVVFQEKVVMLYESRQEAPNEALQTSTTNTSAIGRVLGYGNVAIRTLMGTIMFREIVQPEQVRGIVEQQQLRAQTGQRQAEKHKLEKKIAETLGYLPMPKPAAPKKLEKPPSELKLFFSDILHVRYERNGAIIYRTHWFILLTKVWFQTLVLFGLFAIIGMRLFNQYNFVSLVAVCGVTGFIGIFVLGWLIYNYWDWHNDVYIITNDQVIDVYKKPLGSEQRDVAPINKIQSIEYKRLNFFGLLLNYGTVYILVGERKLTFDDVYNPSGVQRELFDKLTAKTYTERQAAQEADRQRTIESLVAYDQVLRRNQPPASAPPPPTIPPAKSGF